MQLSEKIASLLADIQALQQNPTPESKLPQNTYYLNERDILCMERQVGENRFPYDADGLVVWARASGHIEAIESTLTVLKSVSFSEDPSIAFFAGFPRGDGTYFPVSILGIGGQMFEPEGVQRYVVYGPKCAYYITDTAAVTFAVRLYVSPDKHIRFSYIAMNKTADPQKFYMEANMECGSAGNLWGRLNKYGQRYGDNAYMLRTDGFCMVINRARTGGVEGESYYSVAKSDLIGGYGRMLSSAIGLREGKLLRQRSKVNTVDLPAISEMVHYTLPGGEEIRWEYDLSYYYGLAETEPAIGALVDSAALDKEIAIADEEEFHRYDSMTIRFDDWKGKLNAGLINRFIRSVQKQVSLCALGKNYVGAYLGVRDVMQQLESSLIWQPEISRQKIVSALNYILEDGRPPRQFAIPPTADVLPAMDLRKFIDQGVWIISTVYTYLAFTDDYSILDESCSYYIADEGNTTIVDKSKITDTVLDHLLNIMDFLARNLDTEDGTNCLRILYGDWNDAINGLGNTTREGREFGTGVSVMATLQYWQNLREMVEILDHLGKHADKAAKYRDLADKLEIGVKDNAIVTNDKGEKRVAHGWGDLRSYFIGSWNDPDGVERVSTTAHAFWVLSGMLERTPELKSAVTNALHISNSRYGFRTFDKPFPKSVRAQVGRVVDLTPGTFENAAAYVHAGTFAIMALFMAGESAWAWKELEQAMVISHDNCTLTAFVMPNSYCESEEYGIDGDSMGDWYTGSGTVLIKELVRCGFGIHPVLDGLWLQVPATMPCDNGEIAVTVKGSKLKLTYHNEGKGGRTYTINGETVVGEFDPLLGAPRVFIPTAALRPTMEIVVTD